jgi:hypothetical protein
MADKKRYGSAHPAAILLFCLAILFALDVAASAAEVEEGNNVTPNASALCV